MTTLIVASAGLSDIGRKRRSNQDAYLLDDAHGLYVVADGMGGHQAGEVAAKMVVDAMRRYITSGSSAMDFMSDDHRDTSLSSQANHLLGAIHYANQQVHQASTNDPAYKGMGSTLAVVQFTDSGFVAANVGDSPIYLVHESHIEMLSVPHTLMAEQADIGIDGSLFAPELQHVLTRGMGAEDKVQPDICEGPCFNGDRLVLCSDGLSGKVAPNEILEAVTHRSAPDACRFLVDTANRRGGDDNITVIVLHVQKPHRVVKRLRRWISRLVSGGPWEA